MANDLPSGPETDIAIENGHLIRGFTHWEWWFSIGHIFLYVYQRVYPVVNNIAMEIAMTNRNIIYT